MQTTTVQRLNRLTEAELDAANADRLAALDDASPYWAHTGCCGSCSQGRLDCDCDPDASMWQPELSSTWLVVLYAAIAIAAVAASALWPWGFA